MASTMLVGAAFTTAVMNPNGSASATPSVGSVNPTPGRTTVAVHHPSNNAMVVAVSK